MEPLANQPIEAFAGEPVTIRIENNLITVGYATQDGHAHLVPVLERLRIDGDRAVLLNPTHR